jgi:hypothetical protein
MMKLPLNIFSVRHDSVVVVVFVPPPPVVSVVVCRVVLNIVFKMRLEKLRLKSKL